MRYELTKEGAVPTLAAYASRQKDTGKIAQTYQHITEVQAAVEGGKVDLVAGCDLKFCLDVARLAVSDRSLEEAEGLRKERKSSVESQSLSLCTTSSHAARVPGRLLSAAWPPRQSRHKNRGCLSKTG